MSTEADTQARPASRAAAAVRDLHPGYFAFVMATGIISTGTFLLGPSWLLDIPPGIPVVRATVAAAFLARVARDLAAPASRPPAASADTAAAHDPATEMELP